MRKKLLFGLVATCCYYSAAAQITYLVKTRDVKADIPKTLWGLFFEDINRAGDGGLYAELVKNASFDFPKPLTAWQTWPTQLPEGTFLVNSTANAADPKFISVSTLLPRDTVGLINTGFNGMNFRKNEAYRFQIRYRSSSPTQIAVYLADSQFRHLDKRILQLPPAKDWTSAALDMIAGNAANNGKLIVLFEGQVTLDIDRMSLMPGNALQNYPSGLRPDLVKTLRDLHPGFLRFPGGCIVEGNQLANRYQWKNTIGPLEDRKMLPSYWSGAVPERAAPDYFQSFGLGFLEYFELCEAIGADPLPMVNVGMSCEFEQAEVVPMNEMKPYIQDALDLVEFANGDTTTLWGRKRALYGHPRPFNMRMIGIGNENWGPQYAERLKLFTAAIKEKYPQINIVNATGYSRNKPVFQYMDSVLRARHADIIDEHFYDTPRWFMDNAGRYDKYDRSGPKIFVGEYAAQSDRVGSLKNTNNLETALAEACFMTGIERNADIVQMASYAPLFAHTSDWQWTPNLIWFDSQTSYNTPNYYVQQLFSGNKGTAVVTITQQGQPVTGQDSCWASAVIDQKSHELIVKIVNMARTGKQVSLKLADNKYKEIGSLTVLAGQPENTDSINRPDVLQPVTHPVVAKGNVFHFQLAATDSLFYG